MELIKVINENGKNLVSARDLHEFLGLDKNQISRWLKTNIANNDFLEFGVDYVKLDINVEGIYVIDYKITLDTAKRLALKSNSKKSEAIRSYFIEVEKQATRPLSQLEIMQSSINALIEQDKRLALVESRLNQFANEVKPKIDYYNSVLDSETLISTNTIAQDLGISSIALNKLLVENKIIYKQGGKYFLHSVYRGEQLAGYKSHIYTDSNGVQRTVENLNWTQKGREFIFNECNKSIAKTHRAQKTLDFKKPTLTEFDEAFLKSTNNNKVKKEQYYELLENGWMTKKDILEKYQVSESFLNLHLYASEFEHKKVFYKGLKSRILINEFSFNHFLANRKNKRKK